MTAMSGRLSEYPSAAPPPPPPPRGSAASGRNRRAEASLFLVATTVTRRGRIIIHILPFCGAEARPAGQQEVVGTASRPLTRPRRCMRRLCDTRRQQAAAAAHDDDDVAAAMLAVVIRALPQPAFLLPGTTQTSQRTTTGPLKIAAAGQEDDSRTSGSSSRRRGSLFVPNNRSDFSGLFTDCVSSSTPPAPDLLRGGVAIASPAPPFVAGSSCRNAAAPLFRGQQQGGEVCPGRRN